MRTQEQALNEMDTYLHACGIAARVLTDRDLLRLYSDYSLAEIASIAVLTNDGLALGEAVNLVD